MTAQLQAQLLLLSLFLLFLSGFGTLLLGSQRSHETGSRANAPVSSEGAWLVWSGFALFACDLLLNCRELFSEGVKAIAWSHAWMLPQDQLGAVTAGISIDPTCIIFSLFLLIASILFLVVLRPSAVIHGALAIAASGSALGWFATTPWLNFLGIAIATLGGFIALCSDRNSQKSANLAAQYAWQRYVGLTLAVLGAGAIAGTRNALITHGLGAGDDAGAAWKLVSNSEVLGGCLLSLGLLFQFQGFPLLGWSMSRSGLRVAERAFLTMILPGSTALSFLLKLEPALRGSELIPWLAWFAVASAVLTLLAGLFNPRKEAALLAWISAGFSLSIAAAFRAGPGSGIALAVATALPAFALSLLLESPSRHAIERIAAVLAAGAGAGLIGFVSAGGWFDWIAHDNFIAAVFFLHSILGWSLAWEGVVRAGSDQDARSPWAPALSAMFVSLLATGLLWSGSLSGGLIRGEGDQVFAPLARLVFSLPDGTDVASVNLIFGLTFLLSPALAIWLPFDRMRNRFPGGPFMAQGYQFDSLGVRIEHALAALGRIATGISEDRIWKAYLPNGLLVVLKFLAEMVQKASEGIYRGLTLAVDRGVAGPTRFLQLVQSGDVQWYLFFAMGSGFLLFLYFSRT